MMVDHQCFTLPWAYLLTDIFPQTPLWSFSRNRLKSAVGHCVWELASPRVHDMSLSLHPSPIVAVPVDWIGPRRTFSPKVALALSCAESVQSAERRKQDRKKTAWHFRLVVLPPLHMEKPQVGKNLCKATKNRGENKPISLCMCRKHRLQL